MSFKNGKYLSIVCFSRPPSSSERPITLLADSMFSVSFDCLVLGGHFNLPNLTCKNVAPSEFPGSLTYTNLNNPVTNSELQQHVVSHTRIGLKRASTLGRLFSNERSPISSVSVLPGISGHEVVVGQIKRPKHQVAKLAPRKVYLYSLGNYEAMAVISSLITYLSFKN